MRYALTGKCSCCGRKNEWNDSECPGCHVKRRPWMSVLTAVGTLLLAMSVVALGAGG